MKLPVVLEDDDASSGARVRFKSQLLGPLGALQAGTHGCFSKLGGFLFWGVLRIRALLLWVCIRPFILGNSHMPCSMQGSPFCGSRKEDLP